MSYPAVKLKISNEAAVRVPGVVVGVIVGENRDGRPLVRWAARQRARAVATLWMEDPPRWSACKGIRAVLGFEGGDEAKPLLLGLLDAPRHLDTISEAPIDREQSVPSSKPKVLRIESEQELVLECGKAKIALRADGRVTILGGYVLTRSKGVNKIRGASVQIN